MPVVRLGSRRRGAPGERGLTAGGADRNGLPAAVVEALLRPALEAAWLVARSGERASPHIPAPRPMRRLLAHARLTPAALKTVRKVVDDDEAFRERVADIVTEKAVGRAGWLFLARPEGWEAALAELAEAEAETEEAARAAQEERSATRRLRGAEEALRRSEDGLREARAEAARAAAELARERRSRRAAEADAESLRRRATSLEGEAADAEELRRRVAALESEVAALRAAAESATPSAGPAPSESAVPAEPAASPPFSSASSASPAADAVALAALREAADTARALAAVLGELAVGVPTRGVDEASEAPTEPAAPPAGSAPQDGGGGPRRPRRRPRPPVLPPGILDDTPEAAEHLVRTKGALLLVDGYNASLRWRADLPVPELRHRLVAALDELAARTGADVHVVFDGAEGVEPLVGGARPGAGRRIGARVSFSPPEVEADDVILDLAAATPPGRVALVASDDRRVQDGARELGAAVLTTAQLFAVLRRER